MNTAIIMDMMFNTEMIVKDMNGGKEDMTEKRFTLVDDYLIGYDGDYFDLHKPSNIRSLVIVIKYVTDENEQLKKALVEFKEIGDYQYDRIKELSDENEQLKQLVNEAEDIIICQCTPHYQRQWENIKKNLKGDVE